MTNQTNELILTVVYVCCRPVWDIYWTITVSELGKALPKLDLCMRLPEMSMFDRNQFAGSLYGAFVISNADREMAKVIDLFGLSAGRISRLKFYARNALICILVRTNPFQS